jgi:hypothetical protein
MFSVAEARMLDLDAPVLLSCVVVRAKLPDCVPANRQTLGRHCLDVTARSFLPMSFEKRDDRNRPEQIYCPNQTLFRALVPRYGRDIDQ